jgi:hypothetical protein
MTSNIDEDTVHLSDAFTSNIILEKFDEKLEHCIQLETDIMKSDEYKELFNKAKAVYPDEYEYLIHMACVSYFEDKDKS